jgi:ribose transport system permease protein
MKNVIKKFSRELEVVAALAVIMVVFGVIQPIYFSPSNLLDILDQSVINGLLAIGMTLVIITAGIDLTVGSTLAIVIVSVGNFLVMGLNPFAAVLAGAAIGFGLGLVNGILVAKMKLQPFVATLGMMSVYRGVAYLITGGWPVLNIPQNFRDIMDGDVIGTLSSSMILFLVVTAAAYILHWQQRGGHPPVRRQCGFQQNHVLCNLRCLCCVCRDGHAGKTGNRRTGGRSQL